MLGIRRLSLSNDVLKFLAALIAVSGAVPSHSKAQTTSDRPPSTLAMVCRQGRSIERVELFSFFRARKISNLRFPNSDPGRSLEETQQRMLARLSNYPLLKERIEASLTTVRSEWNQEVWDAPRPTTAAYAPSLNPEAPHCQFEELAQSGRTGDGPVIIARDVYLALTQVEKAAAQLEQAMIRILQKAASETVQPSLEPLSQSVVASLFATPFSHDTLNEKTWVAELIIGQNHPLSNTFGTLVPAGLYYSLKPGLCHMRITNATPALLTLQWEGSTQCSQQATTTISCNYNFCIGELERGTNAAIFLSTVSYRLFKMEIIFGGTGVQDVNYYHY